MSTVTLDSAHVAALSSDTAGQVSGVVYGRGAPVASVGSFTLNLAGVVTAQRGQSGPARWGKLDAVAGRAGHPEGLDRPCWTGPGQWTGPAGMTRAVGSRRPCWPQMAPTCGHVGARVCPQWLGVARTPIDVDAL